MQKIFNNSTKDSVKRNFNSSYTSYSEYAQTQKSIAYDLVRFLRDKCSSFNPLTILDIGCGSGFVIDALLPHYPDSFYSLNDFAENVIKASQQKYKNNAKISFLNKDAENFNFSYHDLITSSMSFQWFDNLNATLIKLFKQTDTIAFSTLYSGTFNEWSNMYKRLGLQSPAFTYPSVDLLKEYCKNLKAAKEYYQVKTYKVAFGNSLDFATHLKTIGANANAVLEINRTSIFTNLRKVIRCYTTPFEIEYKVFFAILSR